MKTVGIVAEYNPFHAGHRKQFDQVKAEFGGETAIVCAMSGNYVQRGAPATHGWCLSGQRPPSPAAPTLWWSCQPP